MKSPFALRLPRIFLLLILAAPIASAQWSVPATSNPAEISHGSLSEIRFRPFVFLRIRDREMLELVERIIDEDPRGQLISVENATDADFVVAFVGKPATDPTGVKSGFALPDPSQIASDHKGQMIVYTKTAHGQMRVLWQDQKGSNRPERAMFEFLQTLSQGKPASSHINYFSPAEAKELGLETLTKDVRPDIYYKENAKRTAKAREHDIEGTVALSVIFGADGELSDLLVLKGLPYGLTARCLEALKKIRFRPAMKDGKPVSVRSSIEFNFQTYR